MASGHRYTGTATSTPAAGGSPGARGGDGVCLRLPELPPATGVHPHNHFQRQVLGAFPSAENFRTCSATGRVRFPSPRSLLALGAHPSPAPPGRAPTTQPGCQDGGYAGALHLSTWHLWGAGRGLQACQQLGTPRSARSLPGAPGREPPTSCTHLASRAPGGRATAGRAALSAPSRGRGSEKALWTDG